MKIGKCSICNRPRLVQINRQIKKMVCRPCYQREFRPRRKCSLCGRVKPVAMRIEKGPICNACYQRKFYIEHREKCSLCEKIKLVEMRTKDDKPLCRVCYYKKGKELCPKCGKRRIVQALGECYPCHQQQKRESLKIKTLSI